MTELGELGLSSYEEKVYRALLVTGAATATDISAASGVPKGRIYDVLNNLQARQLIRTQSTEPTRYIAEQPDTVVDRLLAERTAELQQEWARYRNVANSVRSNLLPTLPTDASIWLGTLGSEEMQTALQEHMETATNSVHAIVGPPYESAPWETFKREVEAFFDGAQSGISVSLLISEQVLETTPKSLFDTAEEHVAEVRIRVLPEVSVSFDIIDQTVTTIDIPHPQRAIDRIGVVAVNDSDIVDEFERQFQELWSEAVPLRE
ncbi:helix-turn-helix domain-containing protein [Halobellus sp. H-GB7]|uniref:TrmB family transcriptional regulator n=1 Tax=Halobellus sp. H-GB7 TaxID=3069756 RepID=UPI0027B0CF83|nr:helix-turn-helix domain-containing protein [Halobellus sp. H-GB7]MDQ2055516.1 helix-turn-helix domain-containing protein [Halobellus sp. H-GB7]